MIPTKVYSLNISEEIELIRNNFLYDDKWLKSPNKTGKYHISVLSFDIYNWLQFLNFEF